MQLVQKNGGVRSDGREGEPSISLCLELLEMNKGNYENIMVHINSSTDQGAVEVGVLHHVNAGELQCRCLRQGVKDAQRTTNRISRILDLFFEALSSISIILYLSAQDLPPLGSAKVLTRASCRFQHLYMCFEICNIRPSCLYGVTHKREWSRLKRIL